MKSLRQLRGWLHAHRGPTYWLATWWLWLDKRTHHFHVYRRRDVLLRELRDDLRRKK